MIGRATDPGRCKERVADTCGWGMRQCARKHTAEGYCKQHHPDAVKQRVFESNARWKAKLDRQREQRHRPCRKRIEELEKEVLDLKLELQADIR